MSEMGHQDIYRRIIKLEKRLKKVEDSLTNETSIAIQVPTKAMLEDIAAAIRKEPT